MPFSLWRNVRVRWRLTETGVCNGELSSSGSTNNPRNQDNTQSQVLRKCTGECGFLYLILPERGSGYIVPWGLTFRETCITEIVQTTWLCPCEN